MPLNAGSLGNVFIRASRPPQTWLVNRDPNQYDTQGYALLDEWLNTTSNVPWVLVSLKGNALSRGELAVWINLGGGDIETLTGNTGGAVGPDGAFNINVVGDGTTIAVAGNPGTNTLTISTVGTGVVNTLTGNSGGAVSPLAGNINVVGTGVITVAGNPGTHTLTVTPSGAIASSFITNPVTGTATPAAGVLTFAGTGDVTVTAAGSTVTINSLGSGISTWVDVTGASQAIAANTGYTANRGTLITFTLPAVVAYGTVFEIVGKGVGLWTIAQNAGQIIHFGSVNTSVGVAGSISSTLQYDTISILCSVANTGFTVRSCLGDLTYI